MRLTVNTLVIKWLAVHVSRVVHFHNDHSIQLVHGSNRTSLHVWIPLYRWNESTRRHVICTNWWTNWPSNILESGSATLFIRILINQLQFVCPIILFKNYLFIIAYYLTESEGWTTKLNNYCWSPTHIL